MWSGPADARGSWEKLQQVCAFRRLQELQAYSPEGEPFRTLKSTNVSGVIALVLAAGEFLGRAGSRSLHTSPEPITLSFQIKQRRTQDWGFSSHRPSADGQKQMQMFADSLR
ncbi:unnamed protein product [Rangifer tarandus platyrhynchus]|uniref:Uncharacterized protein n=2 Tax=Rangifer tarandus platyrhynchus TaxID=3082113 RepID=A0AC59ZGI9_RANTA|nr:unnamed protein product [Rangifer tarandus platyrhynchus]